MRRPSLEVPIKKARTQTPLEGDSSRASGARQKKERKPRQKFGFAESGHPIAEKYSPVYLGQGGESLVYEIPGRPKFVVKANKKVLYDTLLNDPFSYLYHDEKEGSVLRDARLKLEYERRIMKKMREIFGDEHVVRQRKFLQKVPVTEEIMDAVEKQFDRSGNHAGAIPIDAPEAWTLVTIQEKIDIPPDALCPKGGYPEKRFIQRGLYRDPLRREKYTEVTDSLMRCETASNTTSEAFVDLMNNEPLEDFVDHARADEGLREAVRDFLEKTIKFAKETGEILDIVGADNIIFMKEGGGWTYKLIDPIYPFQYKVLRQARKAYEGGKSVKEMSREESNALLHGVVFTRQVNGLALLINEIEATKPESERKLAPYFDFYSAEGQTESMSEKFFDATPQEKAA